MNSYSKAKKVAFLGVFFALAIALSFLENSLPHIPFMPPGTKIGLSNIVIMYCLFFLNPSSAFALAILKAIFALLMRGVTAGLLSFCGGILSIVIMLILIKVSKNKLSYMFLSVCGGISHNIGQFLAISFIFSGFTMLYYLPILVITGIIAGILSAMMLKVILPAVHKIFKIGA